MFREVSWVPGRLPMVTIGSQREEALDGEETGGAGMDRSPEERYNNEAPVGLIYDERMLRHDTCLPHPESPGRIRAIWRELESAGITSRCRVFMNTTKPAEEETIALVHTKRHIDLIKDLGYGTTESDARRRENLAAGFNSIYFNEGSSLSAFLASGSVLEVTEKVAKGQLRSAIAIVRPPGHHAEADEAMGFCLFNNVAIAASFLLNERPELGVQKILIVDWDVHHGNGTQKMFWNDPSVLYFSVHRFDFGTFYPAGDDGSHTMIGEGLGAGYNINVPWEHGQCGDADYLAVWDHILLPVAEAYNPDIILISGGFDAAIGDPLGGCCITPLGYFIMTRKLMKFAQGKIVIALEGGYNLKSLSKSVRACAEALLKEKSAASLLDNQPFESTLRVIHLVRKELSPYWPTFASDLPQDVSLSIKRESLIELLGNSSSDTDAEVIEGPSDSAESTDLIHVANTLDIAKDIMIHLSNLSVDENDHGKDAASDHSATENALSCGQLAFPDQIVNNSPHWRSLASKIYVWYGTYGSNMWKPRFLCYIEGGKVEGMRSQCLGSRDKSNPKEIIWITIPHCLFFARSHTRTWGAGGVAFLHPKRSINNWTYMCLYKITLEQFNDVLLQENALVQDNAAIEETVDPLLNCSSLGYIKERKLISLEALKGGWYSDVLYLKELDGIPVLTMTCSLEQIEGFKSGRLPMAGPAPAYANTLVKGLVEGKQLSESEALEYISNAKL